MIFHHVHKVNRDNKLLILISFTLVFFQISIYLYVFDRTFTVSASTAAYFSCGVSQESVLSLSATMRLWDRFPLHIRTAESIYSFRQCLKSHSFLRRMYVIVGTWRLTAEAQAGLRVTVHRNMVGLGGPVQLWWHSSSWPVWGPLHPKVRGPCVAMDPTPTLSVSVGLSLHIWHTQQYNQPWTGCSTARTGGRTPCWGPLLDTTAAVDNIRQGPGSEFCPEGNCEHSLGNQHNIVLQPQCVVFTLYATGKGGSFTSLFGGTINYSWRGHSWMF